MTSWSKELKCHGMNLCDCPIEFSETNLSKLYKIYLSADPDVWFGAARALFSGMNQLWHSYRMVTSDRWVCYTDAKNLSQWLTEDDCVVLSTYNSSGWSRIILTLLEAISKGFRRKSHHHLKLLWQILPLWQKRQDKIQSIPTPMLIGMGAFTGKLTHFCLSGKPGFLSEAKWFF